MAAKEATESWAKWEAPEGSVAALRTRRAMAGTAAQAGTEGLEGPVRGRQGGHLYASLAPVAQSHCFPTRISSALPGWAAKAAPAVERWEKRPMDLWGWPQTSIGALWPTARRQRSEEHTSELQSR